MFEEIEWESLYLKTFGQVPTSRKFVANFGITPAIFVYLWTIITISPENEKIKVKPVHFFWVFDWLKSFATFESLCNKYDTSDTTLRRKIWNLVDLLYNALEEIDLEKRFIQNEGTGLWKGVHLLLDCTVCPIETPNKETQQLFYSHKHHNHCRKWEVAIRREDGYICWLSDGYAGSIHDNMVLKCGELLKELPKNELVAADLGYLGNENIMVPFKRPRGGQLTREQVKFNKKFGKVRVKVENIFAQMKIFQALKADWRMDYEKQDKIFWIIANINNIKIKCSEDEE